MGLAVSLGSAQAETHIKIGILNDRSGPYADLAGEGSVIAAQMAAQDFNGASKGISVEIVSADHQNKPDVAAAIARSWIDRDGVDVIADVPGSAIALAIADIVKQKDRIQLNSGAGAGDLTGAKCSTNTVHWTYDTWALAHGTGSAMVKLGGDTWFFIAADYAFGQTMQRDTTAVVEASGGKVLGSVRHPLATSDFSSYLLQAQASGAKVIGLANGGANLIDAVKQASEFHIVQGGQSLASLVAFITDIHALGLETAQGMVLTSAFYWDRTRRAAPLPSAIPTPSTAGSRRRCTPASIPRSCIISRPWRRRGRRMRPPSWPR